MRTVAIFGAVQAAVAVACILAVPPIAQAQDIRITAPTAGAAAAPPNPADDPQPGKPLTPEESALLGNALLFDPVNVASGKPVRAPKLPSLSKPRKLSVDGSDNPDGTQKVTVKQPLAADTWEANVGADLNTAASPPTTFEPGKPYPGTVNDNGSGAAWASIGVANFASVDARVNPTSDQGQVGAGLKHSIPLGDTVAVTVQERYSVTETYSAPITPSPVSPSGLPLMAAPTPSEPVAQGPSQIVGNDRSVKLNIKPTGTTLGAGFTTASNDPVTHNTLSADQTIFGPLHVTTSVTDVGQATSSKSITAGFKLNW
jgi:hypothetical protein